MDILNLTLRAASRGVGLAVAFAVSTSSYASDNDNVVIKWNEILLQAVRDTNPGPPVVSRMLAIVHTCMYDAWAAYDDSALGTQFKGKLRQPKADRNDNNRQEAISYAAYTAAVDLFPSETAKFDDLMASMGYPLEGAAAEPSSVGVAACDAVLKFRHGDGANQLGDLSPGAYTDYTGYQPINTPDQIVDPNYWQPLRMIGVDGEEIVQTFLVPYWGEVTPFSFNSPNRFRLKEPAPFGSEEYVAQAREVLAYSANLTEAQKVTAEYWADGPHSETPPGHWNLFAQFISKRDDHDMGDDVKMFFALNNAVFDAGVVAWWAKRKYDYVRPITAINYLYEGQEVDAWAGPYQGAGPIWGEEWRPYQAVSFVTPPFSEYVSGHSTFSAAAAEVLRSFTGSDFFGYSATIEVGSSLVEPGMVPASPLTLSWPTLSAAADDAGLSRLYGGIHFRDGDMEGRRIGKQIGELTWKKSQKLFKR